MGNNTLPDLYDSRIELFNKKSHEKVMSHKDGFLCLIILDSQFPIFIKFSLIVLMSFKFSERDRQLYNKRKKSSLYIIFEDGKVAIRIQRKIKIHICMLNIGIRRRLNYCWKILSQL